MQTQYSVLIYSIDLYFHAHKLATDIHENSHSDTNIECKLKRRKESEQELVTLLELILTKKTLIFLKLSMKYLGTSYNRQPSRINKSIKQLF